MLYVPFKYLVVLDYYKSLLSNEQYKKVRL